MLSEMNLSQIIAGLTEKGFKIIFRGDVGTLTIELQLRAGEMTYQSTMRITRECLYNANIDMIPFELLRKAGVLEEAAKKKDPTCSANS